MSNPDDLRRDIERTRVELGQDVDALADKVTPSKIAERQTRKVRRAMTSVKDRVMGVASDVTDSTHDAIEHAGDALADAPQKVVSGTRGNPIAVGLIAFGVGWLAASLIPASNVERRAADQAKDAAAPLLDEVKDVAAETADHLREPAKNAVDAVKDRATRGSGHRTRGGRGCRRRRADRSEARRRESPVVGRQGSTTGRRPSPSPRLSPRPGSAPCRRPASMASTRFEGRISCSSAARRSLPDGFSHLQARALRPMQCRLRPSHPQRGSPRGA